MILERKQTPQTYLCTGCKTAFLHPAASGFGLSGLDSCGSILGHGCFCITVATEVRPLLCPELGLLGKGVHRARIVVDTAQAL